MAIQLSDTARNARLNAIETDTAGTAKLLVYDLTAGAPANCGAAITATTLATLTLPADYFTAASGGSMVKNGTWSGTASGAGTADFFRLMKNDGTTCQMQGTVGTAATDLIVDNDVFAVSQTFTVSQFTLTDANA